MYAKREKEKTSARRRKLLRSRIVSTGLRNIYIYIYIYIYCGNRRFPYLLYTFVGIPQTVNLIVANRMGLSSVLTINPLKPKLNPICYLLALLAHHFLHVSRIRVKSLTFRRLMLHIYIYIYMEHPFLMFLDHTQRRSTVGRTPLDE